MRNMNLDHAHFYEIASEILKAGKSFRFKARGGSMRPFLLHGDVLTIGPVDTASLRWGDFLFCLTDERRIVVHRYIGRVRKNDRQSSLLVKGDGTPRSADFIAMDRVLGRVVQVQRNSRVVRHNSLVHRGAAYLWVKTSPVSNLLLSRPVRAVGRFLGFSAPGNTETR